MGNYFDYRDWKIEELVDSLRETIAESKKPIPPKVTKHFIYIRYKIGEGRYSWGPNNYWASDHYEFKTREDAINFLNSKGWIERTGENMWIDKCYHNPYEDSNGNLVDSHYEIVECDNEVFEDGERHIEYTEEEKKLLSDALYQIEKARVYMRAYDNAMDNCSFGGGSFTECLKDELEKFENEYTESIIDTDGE